jgi:hypothetical protein
MTAARAQQTAERALDRIQGKSGRLDRVDRLFAAQHPRDIGGAFGLQLSSASTE